MVRILSQALLITFFVVIAPSPAKAQASDGLRCISAPSASCVIDMAMRSVRATDKAFLSDTMLVKLAMAMVYDGQTERGLELSRKVRSPLARGNVNLAMAFAYFQRGDFSGARKLVEDQQKDQKRRVYEVSRWAIKAFSHDDGKRGNAALSLARALSKGSQSDAAQAVFSETLASAIAASGDLKTAIEMVDAMPDRQGRLNAALLVALDAKSGFRIDWIRELLEKAATWRAELPATIQPRYLPSEALAWLKLDEIERALNLANEMKDEIRRDYLLHSLIGDAGRLGKAKAALALAEIVKSTPLKGQALALCARNAFVAKKTDTALVCLEIAQTIKPHLLTKATEDSVQAEDRSANVAALTNIAAAESLAGDDDAVKKIITDIHWADAAIQQEIIRAHIDVGEYSLAMLMTLQVRNAKRHAQAFSYLAEKLGLEELQNRK